MSATTEDPEALRFDSHGGGSRNAPFRVYRQTPARRAAASNAVPFVRLRHLPSTSRISGNDDDLSRLVDFNPGDMHTGRGDGFDRSGHVLLSECGRRACHGKLSAVIVGGTCHRRSSKESPNGPSAGLLWRRYIVTVPVGLSIAAVLSVSATTGRPRSSQQRPDSS